MWDNEDEEDEEDEGGGDTTCIPRRTSTQAAGSLIPWCLGGLSERCRRLGSMFVIPYVVRRCRWASTALLRTCEASRPACIIVEEMDVARALYVWDFRAREREN